MNNTSIRERLLGEIVVRDYTDLTERLKDVSFVDAYNTLKGFNLTTNPMFANGKLKEVNTFFDFNYKSLNGTIHCDNGKCKVHGLLDVWLEDESSPIAKVRVTDEGVSLVIWND